MLKNNCLNKLWGKFILYFIFAIFLIFSVSACTLSDDMDNKSGSSMASESEIKTQDEEQGEEKAVSKLSEKGHYISKEEVALYIHIYGKLPSNYVTKKEAQSKGWDSKEGNLNEVLPGMSIGGDKFGNREGLLPRDKNRKYYECDVNYKEGFRNGERIVYSNDGLIFYTSDHYKTFE